MKAFIVTIDGAAASGKGTIAKYIKNYKNFSTIMRKDVFKTNIVFVRFDKDYVNGVFVNRHK